MLGETSERSPELSFPDTPMAHGVQEGAGGGMRRDQDQENDEQLFGASVVENETQVENTLISEPLSCSLKAFLQHLT